MTNESYRNKKLAIVQKIPTPITPVKIDNESRNITLAYFGQKSTVDYIGAVQGVPVCFDAKETSSKSLPIQNIHEHQIEFMREFKGQGGLAFLIVHFKMLGEYFLLPIETLENCWESAKSGGKKSISYDKFDKTLKIESKSGYFLHYLEAVSTYAERT